MKPSPLVVNISQLLGPDWSWVRSYFPEVRWLDFGGYPSDAFGQWVDNRITPIRAARYRASLQGTWAAKLQEADVIVTHEPLVAAWTGMLYQALGLTAPHLAFGFTFSNIPTGFRHTFFKKAMRKVDRLVSFSSVERARYAEYLELPLDRVDVLRWSVGEPNFDLATPPVEEQPYLCAVGSEGRDYATLLDAMRQLPDLRLALVAKPENMEGLDVPSNVSVRTNIPLEEVWNIVGHSRVHVLPLRDTKVPCGHGTVIMAMQLKTPSIVTESEGMTDYIEGENTGLTCPPRDATELASAIRRLWDDEALHAALTDRGRTFAIEECSEPRTAAYFRDYLGQHGVI